MIVAQLRPGMKIWTHNTVATITAIFRQPSGPRAIWIEYDDGTAEQLHMWDYEGVSVVEP